MHVSCCCTLRLVWQATLTQSCAIHLYVCNTVCSNMNTEQGLSTKNRAPCEGLHFALPTCRKDSHVSKFDTLGICPVVTLGTSYMDL
jgi:hypothetical protein